MASEEQRQHNEETIAKQRPLLARCEWHSCVNCTHLRYSGATPTCGLFASAPPLPVLVCGCAEWESAVPF